MSRILVLSSFPVYPANDGGRVRVHQFAAHLAARHDVTVVCPRLAQPPPTALPYRLLDVAGAGPRRQLVDLAFLRRLLRIVREERPDVLLLEYAWQGLHANIASALCGVPLVVDAFDVLTTRFRRQRHPLWPAISLYERAVLRRASRVFAISPVDLAAFRKLGVPSSRLSLVPGGIDASVFHPDDAARNRIRPALGIADDTPVLLFFGQLSYAPNADALDVLARAVLPRIEPQFEVLVAGRGDLPTLTRRYEGSRLRFLGPVDSIADHINAADAVVAPIRSGSGTRFKLLETVACGVPAVSTTLGAEGLSPEALASGIVIRDDWSSFAQAANEAARWPRRQPSSEFLEQHDWRAIINAVPL